MTTLVGRLTAAPLVAALLVAFPRLLAAQCPDGTPPPCAGQRVALNPNRIAILPFRVTAADTLLGEGLAELLAPEFTGENGPLAVNTPTVLRMWRRAGGALRTPLDPVQVQRVAREIGAGRVVDGSVVGLGSAITLTASVVELPGGTMRRIGPLSGPTDSLQSLVGRLASGLLGATGATPVDLTIRLTDSPAAMRAYLEGLAHYRAGRFNAAAPMFERALAIDSLFARAALMRYLTGGWLSAVSPWDTLTWRLRDRLSARDRIFAMGLLGERFPAERSPLERLADLRRAASMLPESPEAQFELGDWLYHYGESAGIDDDLASAREELERARSMDPQAEEIGHLLEIGFMTGDTVLVRRMFTEWQRMPGDMPGLGPAYLRVAAWMLRDPAARAGTPDSTPQQLNSAGLGWYWLAVAVTMARLPANDVAWLFGLRDWTELSAAPQYVRMVGHLVMAPATLANTGRPSALPVTRADSGLAWLVQSMLETGGDSAIASLAGMIAQRRARAVNAPLRTQALPVFAALSSRAPDLRARTTALDSAVRWTAANRDPNSLGGFEGLLLALAWEALGEPARALAAIYLDDIWDWGPDYLLAPKLRHEGRLAAMTGDTTRAIRAYRRYLSLRRDADAVLIPERDSVQAALARLEATRRN